MPDLKRRGIVLALTLALIVVGAQAAHDQYPAVPLISQQAQDPPATDIASA